MRTGSFKQITADGNRFHSRPAFESQLSFFCDLLVVFNFVSQVVFYFSFSSFCLLNFPLSHLATFQPIHIYLSPPQLACLPLINLNKDLVTVAVMILNRVGSLN